MLTPSRHLTGRRRPAPPVRREVARLVVALAATVGVVAASALPAGAAAPATSSVSSGASSASSGTASANSGTACGRTSVTLVPSCGALWGVWPRTDSAGTRTNNLPANLASLERAVGRPFDVVSRYKGWGENVYDGWDAGFRDAGRIVLEDLTARSFATDTYTPWADIAAGKHDRYLRAQARRAKAFGARTLFSFGQEPEQALERGNAAGTPADFAAAYRHVHDVFVAAGATNVVWVWWVMGYSGHNPVYPALWPASAYVDWIAYDPYDFNACHHRSGKTPHQTIAPWYRWVTAQPWSAGKPLMLAEYGTNGRDKGSWFAAVPGVLAGLPRIKAAVQFNSRPGPCDHRFTGSANNLAGFRAASSDPYVNPRRRASDRVRGTVPRRAAPVVLRRSR
ncbi:MAG: glycoside hydrolase family 26 protein [Kineosporiaceae bacterium]